MVAYCASGYRSAVAASMLASDGFTAVSDLLADVFRVGDALWLFRIWPAFGAGFGVLSLSASARCSRRWPQEAGWAPNRSARGG